MEVRRGDIVDTVWFKHCMVQRVKYPYIFVAFKKVNIHGHLYADMWIDSRTVKMLYRRSSPDAEL